MIASISFLASVLAVVSAQNNAVCDVAKDVWVFDAAISLEAEDAIAVKNAAECEKQCIDDATCRSYVYYERDGNKTTMIDNFFENSTKVCFTNTLPYSSKIGFDKGRVLTTLLGWHNEPSVGIKKSDGSYEMHASSAIWWKEEAEIIDSSNETMTVKECSEMCTKNTNCAAFSHWTPYKQVEYLDTYLCELFSKYDIPSPLSLDRVELIEGDNMTSVTGNIAARKSDKCMKELDACLTSFQTCCRKVNLLTEKCPESCGGDKCKTNFLSCKSDAKVDTQVSSKSNDAPIVFLSTGAIVLSFVASFFI